MCISFSVTFVAFYTNSLFVHLNIAYLIPPFIFHSSPSISSKTIYIDYTNVVLYIYV